MVLILLGRNGPDHVDRGNSFFWDILSRSFACLVHKVLCFKTVFEIFILDFYFTKFTFKKEKIKKPFWNAIHARVKFLCFKMKLIKMLLVFYIGSC